MAEEPRQASVSCIDWVRRYLQLQGVSVHGDPGELQQWCLDLPNPRDLLCIEAPLSSVAATSCGKPSSDQRVPCVALVFAAPSGEAGAPPRDREVAAGEYAHPTLLSAPSEDALLNRVAETLQCSRAELRHHNVGSAPPHERSCCNVFGCMCKVWYRPPQTKAARDSSMWAWQSDCFAVVLSGPIVPRAGPPGVSAVLEHQLESVASFLTSSVGFPQHPRAVRNALHAQGVPISFAFALAEPQIHAHHSSPGACSCAHEELIPGGYCGALEEAVGTELFATAAKHVVRSLMHEAPVNAEYPGNDGESLTKVTAGIARAEITGAAWHSSKKAVSKVAEIVVGTGVGEAGAIEAEPPIPPLRPQRVPPDDGLDSGSPRGLSSSITFAHCSPSLESEVQHLLTALELHPELERAVREAPGAEQVSICRLALLNVAFWVRLASSAREYQACCSDDGHRGLDPSDLVELGVRLLHAAWRTPPALVRAISAQLGVELTTPVLRRVRPLSESSLAAVPVRLPGPDAPQQPELNVVRAAYFKPKGSMTFEGTVADVLAMTKSCSHSPPAATSAAANLLVHDDLMLYPCWQRSRSCRRSAHADFPAVAEQTSKDTALDNTARGADNLLVAPRLSAAIAAAVLVSREAQDQRFPRHRLQRARDLLRFAQWLLLAVLHQAYCSASLIPVLSEHSGKQRGGAQTTEAEEGCLKTALSAVLHVLQAVLTLLESLGTCPAELLVAMWTLRAYAREKQCQIDECFADYLQALSLIDEAWGDPRKRGGRGHPFALLLTWKLGLISYSRGDAKSIDKFADYFRSLALYHGRASPFTWGPPAGPEADGRGAARPKSARGREAGGQRELGRLLRASEACMWTGGAFWDWWQQHDVLNFAAEGLAVPGSPGASPGEEGAAARGEPPRRRPLQAPEGNVTAELQEVRRGTIFSFGSNHQGQLGVGLPTTRPLCGGSAFAGGAGDDAAGPPSGSGTQSSCAIGTDAHRNAHGHPCSHAGPDLWWSGRPVRIMALKECRMKDVACGEAHCTALDLEGRLFAWGCDEWRQAVHLPVPVLQPSLETLQGMVRFAAVACGAQFSVALDRAGAIWTWGAGEGGVLGSGPLALVGRSQPARLEPLATGPCAAVACGSYHTLAIAGSGELYSWGRAEGGQLGIAEPRVAAHIELRGLNDTCVCEPLRVFFTGGEEGDTAHDTAEGLEEVCDEVADTGCQDDVRVRQAAGGDVHSCALDTEGQVWSWGWGEFGQLGLGFSAASYSIGVGGVSSKRLTPHRVKREHFGSMAIKSVACGGAFSAAVGDVSEAGTGYDGNLFLWGANEVGQCALPSKKPVEVGIPTKVKSLAHTVVRSIACGGSHVIAVDVAGRAYSWGSASYGQLGSFNPPKTFRPPPALDTQEAEGGALARHQPALIQSVSRLHIMKAACGLHHSLLISEVSGESVARRAGKGTKEGCRRTKAVCDMESSETLSGATGPAVAA